jgi:hypothetical protein
MAGKTHSQYRLYCLDQRGRISLAEWIDAADDEDAIRHAQLLKRDGRKCEVWHGTRLVARLEAQDLVA